jgi:tetratricopeptide (TPR) repeat protein
MRGRYLRPIVTVGLAALLLLGVGAVLQARSPAPAGSPQPVTEIVSSTALLDATIERAQERLRRVPGDYVTWAALGSAYLERARISADPTFYEKAEGALNRSLTERPDDNPDALAGLGALANALHDFAEARDLARQAIDLNPYDADAFGVLADAETQLGNAEAATEAVQQMLDLRPGLPAYARASYDLEQHGQTDQAQSLMERALAAAFDPADMAFCHYQLGELAWHAGNLDEAEEHYRAGTAAAPTYLPLKQGLAKVAAARGDLAAAIAGYAEVTAVSPTPDQLMEYAELLLAAGRPDEAADQLSLAEAAHELFAASGGADDLTGSQLAIVQDRPDEGLRLAEREWEQREFADVADTLAWALHLNGRDEEALEYAQRAGELGARNAEYAYHLGMIQLGLGDRDAARDELTRALDLNPYFSPVYAPRATRTLERLES